MTLRESTAQEHAALERTRIMMTVSCGAPTPAQFAEYLARQWILHVALEAALAPWVPEPWIEQRLIKRHWLASDLQALGRHAEARALAIHPIGSTAEALGTLYVLEGSTLGLRIIEKRFAPGHPALDGAGQFIRGYGADNGTRWKGFLDRLEQVPEAEWPAVISAARATFVLFLEEFADEAPA